MGRALGHTIRNDQLFALSVSCSVSGVHLCEFNRPSYGRSVSCVGFSPCPASSSDTQIFIPFVSYRQPSFRGSRTSAVHCHTFTMIVELPEVGVICVHVRWTKDDVLLRSQPQPNQCYNDLTSTTVLSVIRNQRHLPSGLRVC